MGIAVVSSAIPINYLAHDTTLAFLNIISY